MARATKVTVELAERDRTLLRRLVEAVEELAQRGSDDSADDFEWPENPPLTLEALQGALETVVSSQSSYPPASPAPSKPKILVRGKWVEPPDPDIE